MKRKMIHGWECDSKNKGSGFERTLILRELDKYGYKKDSFGCWNPKKEWVSISENIVRIFLNEKSNDNWVYVGSNNSEFLKFLAFDVPVTTALTDNVLVAGTYQQQLIKLFLSKRPNDPVTEDKFGDILQFYKVCGVLVYEDFLAPNTSVPKFMGNFNELFSKRAELNRPTLFLDLRPESPPVHVVIDNVNDMYGRRVECFFQTKGVFKFYNSASKNRILETEKLA